MQYIECPNKEKPKYKSIFLAGGIVDCPDWQSEVVEKFRKYKNVTVLNPRRKSFVINDKNVNNEQIGWEYENLRSSDVLLFWFSVGSVNPIVLFEFGSAMERDACIFVGVHPEYVRKQDVEIQSKLRHPELVIHSSIESLVSAVTKHLKL